MYQRVAAEELPMNRGASSVDRLRAFERARSRWSPIELTFVQFSFHLDRLGWSPQLPPEVEDIYLCAGCSLGSNTACERLEREYFPSLRATVARRFRRWDFVEEVLQLTRERLLVGPSPRIGTYRGDGPLGSWLRQIALHIAIDLHRRDDQRRWVSLADWLPRPPEVPQGTTEEPGLGSNTPEASWLRQLQKALLDAIAELNRTDRQLLHMHHVLGLRVGEIACCLGIDRSTVYRRLHRVERHVERRSIRSLRARTGISDSEELGCLFRRSYDAITVDPAVWIVTTRREQASDGRTAEEAGSESRAPQP